MEKPRSPGGKRSEEALCGEEVLARVKVVFAVGIGVGRPSFSDETVCDPERLPRQGLGIALS